MIDAEDVNTSQNNDVAFGECLKMIVVVESTMFDNDDNDHAEDDIVVDEDDDVDGDDYDHDEGDENRADCCRCLDRIGNCDGGVHVY